MASREENVHHRRLDGSDVTGSPFDGDIGFVEFLSCEQVNILLVGIGLGTLRAGVAGSRG